MESALRHQRTVVLVGLTAGAVTTFRPLPLSASRFAGGLVLRTGDARYADLIERTCPAHGYPVFRQGQPRARSQAGSGFRWTCPAATARRVTLCVPDTVIR